VTPFHLPRRNETPSFGYFVPSLSNYFCNMLVHYPRTRWHSCWLIFCNTFAGNAIEYRCCQLHWMMIMSNKGRSGVAKVALETYASRAGIKVPRFWVRTLLSPLPSCASQHLKLKSAYFPKVHSLFISLHENLKLGNLFPDFEMTLSLHMIFCY